MLPDRPNPPPGGANPPPGGATPPPDGLKSLLERLESLLERSKQLQGKLKPLLGKLMPLLGKLVPLLKGLLNRLPDGLKSRLSKYVDLKKLGIDDDVEIVEAEAVDPNAPLEQGAEPPPEPRTLKERVLALWQAGQRNLHNFFVPQPIMVPAQLKTPEIDLDAEGQPTRLKGQLIYVLIIFFFFVLLSWAGFTEIDELVRAEGDIVPSDSVQVVQSRLPGSVVEIHAKLDDRVSKGQVLFEVEDEDVRANFDDNEIQRTTARAAIARLEAESVGAPEVLFPEGLEVEAPVIVAQERAVFSSRRRALESEREVLGQEIESLRRGIKEREAESRQAKIQIGLLTEERDVIKPLVDQGFEPKTALLNIEGRLSEAVGREELSRLAADRMASDLETQQRRLDSLENRFRAEAEGQLVEQRTLAAQTEARLDALREKVAYAEIRSPVDGIVTAVHVNTVGAVVDGGTVMAEVVPIDEEITVRARVNTDDVSKIFPGDRVYVSVSSYDVSRFGRLEGIVEKVAANSTQQENLPPYFVTMIKVADPVFAETGIVAEIVPGTPVVVDMIAGKRTVLNYILSPINRAQNIAFREK